MLAGGSVGLLDETYFRYYQDERVFNLTKYVVKMGLKCVALILGLGAVNPSFKPKSIEEPILMDRVLLA